MNAVLTVKPVNGLQVDNTYILDRVKHNPVNHAVFNNHILRSQWNYQFTPALSLRFIMQYNDLLANQQFSSLQTTKNLNFDFLLTYLVHPGTAIYAGYNSNLENIDPGLCTKIAGTTECDPNGIGLLHVPNRLLNDGRQVFIKVSYLWHP
jgi:predicted porin